MALFVLTPSSALAHSDAQSQSDLVLVEADDQYDETDVFGHCHGGASCGVGAVLGVAAVSFSCPLGRNRLSIQKNCLSNLVAHKFDPPPPKSLS